MIENDYFFIKLRTTKYYYYFSIFQLIMALGLVTCFITKTSGLILQIIISITLSIDLYFSEKQFLNRKINIIDLFVIILLWIFVLFETVSSTYSMTSDQISFVVIGIRYGIQFYRIIALYKQSNQTSQMQTIPEINLNFDQSCLDVIKLPETDTQVLKKTCFKTL